MDQLGIEKRLSLSYLFCITLGGIASITTGIAWGHWYRTLDQCVGRNCSCIIYGQNTLSHFLGGGQAPCIWVTFGPLLYVFFCICLTCFHGYRVLFTTKSPRMRTTRSVVAKTETGSSVQITAISQEDTSPLPRAFWITMSVFSSFFCAYALINFAVFLDGYYTTCNQYRRVLERMLGIHGSALPVIHGRLYCQSIFDFMDYMHLDSENASRNGFINTGLSLTLGLAASCFAWMLLLLSSILNITMARRKNRKLLNTILKYIRWERCAGRIPNNLSTPKPAEGLFNLVPTSSLSDCNLFIPFGHTANENVQIKLM